MIPQESSLRQLFHEVVFDCYESRLGMHDKEISTYVADLLTEFCRAENVYRIRDAQGKPLRAVGEMLVAADPVLGTAASFSEEREIRKHIGDYTLFLPACIRIPYSARGRGLGKAISNWSRQARRATTSFRSLTSSNTPKKRPSSRAWQARSSPAFMA